MQKGDFLNTILKSDKTIFTLKDIVLLWQGEATDSARVRLNYYVKKGDLYRIRRGVYAKGEYYNKLELATRIFTPAYISFETVLAQEGLIFQYQTIITVASYLTRIITIGEQVYAYRKVKDTVLTNTTGVKQENNMSAATKERAFLDILYNNTDYFFDNMRSLDWDIIFEILPIYENKRMTKKVNQLFKEFYKNSI